MTGTGSKTLPETKPVPKRGRGAAKPGGSVVDAGRPMTTKPTTIDEYLHTAPVQHRPVLEKLRKTIQSAAPKAEECISYGLAAFRLGGRPLVAFGAWANHCSFYPMSARTLKAFQSELRGFKTSKGTVQFHPGQPLRAALVRRLVKARMAENEMRARAG